MKKDKPRLLFYANYYKPDKSAMARLMTELSEGLSDDFDITVVTSVPSYSGVITEEYKDKRQYYEKTDKLHIIRVRVSENDKSSRVKRIQHIFSYFFNALRITIRLGRFDLVYATTAPPLLGGLLGSIGKRLTKGKLLYVIQDFNPEQIEAVGYSRNKILISTLRRIDYKTCLNSDGLVIIGRDMQETLDKRSPDGKLKGLYIHNWVDEDQIYPLEKKDSRVVGFMKKYGIQDKYVFMYLGNLGLYYDLLEFIRLAGKFIVERDVVFAFVGAGAVEKQMKEYVRINKLSNIVFIPYVTGNDLLYAMNSADVHIINNARGIKGVSVPSKLYGVMAVNKPVLGILEPESEAWSVIEETGIGVLCETGDYEAIENRIRYIIDNKARIKDLGGRGRELLICKYSKNDSIMKYKEALSRLLGRNVL